MDAREKDAYAEDSNDNLKVITFCGPRSHHPSIMVEPSEYECSICQKPFREPKLLPCGHLICRQCVVTLLHSQPHPHCPICHFIITDLKRDILEPKQNWASIADGFPTDIAMVAMVEADRLLNRDNNCCLCERHVASALCLECMDLFCGNCKDLHNRQKMAKQHNVRDLTLITIDELASQRAVLCQSHANRVCEMFCTNHNVAICNGCTADKHCRCPGVIKIQQKAADSLVALTKLAARLTACEAELDQALSQLDHHMMETEKNAEAAKLEMEAVRKRLQNYLEAWYLRERELVHSAYDFIDKAVDDAKGCLLQRKSIINQHKKALQRALNTKSRNVINCMTAVLTTRVHNLKCNAVLPEGGKALSYLSMVIDRAVVDWVEEQIAKLARLRIVPPGEPLSPVSTPEIPKEETKKEEPEVVVENALIFHTKHGKNIVLSNNRQTAMRNGNYDYGGVVMGVLPMNVNSLYEVRVDKTDRSDRNKAWVLPVGVVTKEPHTMHVPDSAYNCWSNAVGVWWKCVINNGKINIGVKIGHRLMDLPLGSHVGVLVDNFRRLHLYIDGVDQGVAAVNIPQPCYPFYDVQGQYKQITALAIAEMPPAVISKSTTKVYQQCPCPPRPCQP